MYGSRNSTSRSCSAAVGHRGWRSHHDRVVLVVFELGVGSQLQWVRSWGEPSYLCISWGPIGMVSAADRLVCFHVYIVALSDPRSFPFLPQFLSVSLHSKSGKPARANTLSDWLIAESYSGSLFAAPRTFERIAVPSRFSSARCARWLISRDHILKSFLRHPAQLLTKYQYSISKSRRSRQWRSLTEKFEVAVYFIMAINVNLK